MTKKYTVFEKISFVLSGILALFIVVLFVAFDGKKQEKADRSQDAELTEIKMQRIVKGYVTAGLKDPNSAQFRNQKGFCGEVNAKNSFGGYAGFVRFIAANQDLVFMENNPDLERGAFQQAWDQFCK